MSVLAPPLMSAAGLPALLTMAWLIVAVLALTLIERLVPLRSRPFWKSRAAVAVVSFSTSVDGLKFAPPHRRVELSLLRLIVAGEPKALKPLVPPVRRTFPPLLPSVRVKELGLCSSSTPPLIVNRLPPRALALLRRSTPPLSAVSPV